MTLLERYTGDYLGKIFYFCLKKAGSEEDAAELASNINYEVIKALDKGRIPDNFDAWVWAVARNQWARWATGRFYKTPEQVDIQEYEEVLSSEENLLETVAHREELAMVRRELAFIRSDYRQILVTHYFDEMSVSEIARRFSIPVGTVKTKLQSSRKILKEGMNMAREFGQRSFKPETIGFSASGSQPSGLPWSAVSRMIPVNILCEANNNPSTVEELSMELGIAMPYMEEEVKLLEDAELLRKVEKDKYLTNFFIAPKECQNEINEICCRYAEASYGKIWGIAQKLLEFMKEKGELRGAVSEENAVAYLAFRTEWCLESEVAPENIFTKFKRKDGGTWGFLGRENGAQCRLNMVSFSNNMAVDDSILWNGYQCDDFSDEKLKFYGKKLYVTDVPSWDTLKILKEIAEGKDEALFSAGDQARLQRLLEGGFCVRKDGRIDVAALCIREETRTILFSFMKSLPEYQELLDQMKTHIARVRDVVAKYSVSYLSEDFDYYVWMSNVIRPIVAALWKEKELYTGGNAQFCALIYS